METAKFYDFFQPEQCKDRIHIIGCGAIGSTLAEELTRYGLTNIVLYDFDKVEAHNIANQLYIESDIGMMKVDALKQHMVKINPEAEHYVRTVPEGYKGQRLTGYVFLCVDNIDLRREIAQNNMHNPFIKAMFDFRMGLTDAQHFAADWSDHKQVDCLLRSMEFTHEEAKLSTPVSACNLTLSVCSTVRMIVALGVGNFINFVHGEHPKKLILVDAFKCTVEAYR